MDWDAWPDNLRPKFRLFLSGDVVGSTSLKQTVIKDHAGNSVPDNSQWFETIQSFYILIVDRFFDEFERLKRSQARHLATMAKPVVWKTVGDEVLFWMDVSDSRQVRHYLTAWIAAVKSVKVELQRTNARLDIKSTGWMAHFPWRNKMIFSSRQGFTGAEMDGIRDNNLQLMNTYLSRTPDENFDLVADFVGPGIDIGFRLTAQASSRKFIISLDIAYMLALVSRRERIDLELSVHFDGLQQFKGVLGGLEYPVFWIDVGTSYAIDSYGSDLVKRTRCDAVNLVDFCHSFYEERSNYLYRPFIVSATEKYLKRAPDWYADEHVAMLNKHGFAADGGGEGSQPS